MPLVWLVLLILAILYVPFYIWVRISPKAKEYGLVKYGPCVMVKTQLGKKTMDKYSKYTRFWRAFGIFSQIVALGLMIMILYIMLVGIINLITSARTSGMGIEYALAIPGINPLLPIGYGTLGLFVAMVLHELSHGFQTRANSMKVDSTGLLLLVVPMGAFVEPNEEEVQKASRRAKLDLYSAGISMNFIVMVVSFLLFASVMLGGISSPHGDNAAAYNVTSGSPGDIAGIPSGVIIDTVNGEKFTLPEKGFPSYTWQPGETVTLGYITKDGAESKQVTWGVYIEGVTDNTSASGNLFKGEFLLGLKNITKSGPECKIYAHYQFSEFMTMTSPGDLVEFTIMDNNVQKTKTFEIGERNGKAFTGISTTTSGMLFTTPNIILEKARNPFMGANSITESVTGMMKYITGPFNGFNPIPDSVKWWYDVPFDGLFWMIVSSLYWIFWLNLMLGVSNAIPAIPFDGGFIFLGWLDAILQKAGMKDDEKRKNLSEKITSHVSMVMIVMLVVVIAAVIF